jgi:uncharacterized protein YndB with AHSA1/START domain
MKPEIKISGNRLQITRLFDAPRHLVFAWWTTAEKLQQWSSCKEAIKCEVVMDFRVGGSFTQKMTLAVDGKTCEYSMTGTYDEIVEPERIVYRADFGGFAATRVTVEFIEQAKGTKVILTHDGCPDEFFGQNVSRGTSESFEKLDSCLAGQSVEVPL